MALTTKQIQSLKPRESRYSISDGNGLTLRVQPSGSKSWVFRSHHSGRITDETIGHWPEMSLKQARMIVRRRRKDAGLKPPSGYVLNDAFKLWCGLKKGRIVSYKEERRRLENHIIRALGRKQIDEITAPMLQRLFNKMISPPLSSSATSCQLKEPGTRPHSKESSCECGRS